MRIFLFVISFISLFSCTEVHVNTNPEKNESLDQSKAQSSDNSQTSIDKATRKKVNSQVNSIIDQGVENQQNIIEKTNNINEEMNKGISNVKKSFDEFGVDPNEEMEDF